ncbi:MAG: hypothetical protein JW395_0771 [Nitrospira sp.]|nr:hypothetical protein [Nitrospira sp.]
MAVSWFKELSEELAKRKSKNGQDVPKRGSDLRWETVETGRSPSSGPPSEPPIVTKKGK